MAAPRLPFLWPILFKAGPAPAPHTIAPRLRQALHIHTPRQQQDIIPQRYGSANEPPPNLGVVAGVGEGGTKVLPKIGEKMERGEEAEVKAGERREEVLSPAKDKRTKHAERATLDAAATHIIRPVPGDPILDAAESAPPTEALPTAPKAGPKSVLDAVPFMPQPDDPSKNPLLVNPAISADDHAPPFQRAPHLDPPRHVHHFDTYGLVQDLSSAGWKPKQAITLMKATRLLLADNMSLARAALVSKSFVENETYLFRAACAELKTEVTTRRRVEHERMRTQRAHLQHEVENVTQRVGQDSGALKDDLKGMFDDRRMATRNEQRGMESKIQQLNYRIAVVLQADAKSDVEGLRWVLTRRVIMALGAVVVMVLGSLRLYSNALHLQEAEASRKKERGIAGAGAFASTEGKADDMYVGDGGGEVGEAGRETQRVGEVVLKGGENPGLVSLG